MCSDHSQPGDAPDSQKRKHHFDALRAANPQATSPHFDSCENPAAGEVDVHGPADEPEVRPCTVVERDQPTGYDQRPQRQEVPERFAANVGLLTALGRLGPLLVCSDGLNHASIIDGARLSRAEVAVYRTIRG